MANEPTLTVEGNLAGDPELKVTPSGQSVVNFTVAQTPRNFDKQTNQWVEGETIWQRCTAWRQFAENIAQSLKKGDRVIFTGILKANSYEKDGQKHTNLDLDVRSGGPDLNWATAAVTKNSRDNAPAPAAAPAAAQPVEPTGATIPAAPAAVEAPF